jgi:hypothetical protein
VRNTNPRGPLEVYLRPDPGPGEAIAVSGNGGASPAWNPDGGELFYIEPGASGSAQDRMMTVAFDATGRAGNPTALFGFTRGSVFLANTVFTPYAVAPGGRRFYVVRPLPRTAPPVGDINIVLDWFSELGVKSPATR